MSVMLNFWKVGVAPTTLLYIKSTLMDDTKLCVWV